MNALSLVPNCVSIVPEHPTPEPNGASAHAPASARSIFPVDIASELIHDLRSPLAAVTMNLEYALSELPEGPECDDVRDALRDCNTAGARLARMIANLLDIARAEAGKLTPRTAPVSVRMLLQSIAHATLSDPRARYISLRTEGYDGEFDLDAELMVRALDCLMDAVLCGARAGGKVTLSARLRGGELELRVPTLGAPMAPEDRARVFSKRSRSSVSGFDRGLSLYFCKLVVEAHGGGIGLHEGDDRVTFFRIVLPRSGGRSKSV